MSSAHFDAVVIGSGQGGNPLALALAKAGKRTALVERKHVGGTCINEGCTPTKTMVASGRVAYLARRAADYGVRIGPISVDLKKVRQRKRDIVIVSGVEVKHASGKPKILNSYGAMPVFRGQRSWWFGRKMGIIENFLRIGSSKWGTPASRPKLEGLENIRSLDENESIMELEMVPDHLLVLGGGYIGLEFGQLFRRFGSRVTIVQSGPQLLGREDPDIAEEVTKILREDGIEVLLSARPSV